MAAIDRFVMPFVQWINGNGHPYAGAKLFFCRSGTETPLATYSDLELSVANAHPVVADGEGKFPNIYLMPGRRYKVILKSSADATIWSADPVASFGSGSGDHINVMDFGAVGDGVNDDAPAFQAAFDEQKTSGKPVYAPKPPVRYLWETKVEWLNNDVTEHGPGIMLYGDGSDHTVIRCAVANDIAFHLGIATSFKFQFGGYIEGVKFEQTDPDIENQVLLGIEGAWKLRMRDIHLSGATAANMRWLEASTSEIITGATVTSGSAVITVPDNPLLGGTVIPLIQISGAGIPANAIIVQVIPPNTIIMSLAATASGTDVTLTLTGNQDGNSSGFCRIEDSTIERSYGWAIEDRTSVGVVQLLIERSSIALSLKGQIKWRSSAVQILSNRIYSAGTAEWPAKGPGIYLTSGRNTAQNAYIDNNEFDGNYNAHILADSWTGIDLGPHNRYIAHNFTTTENMRPLRSIRLASLFTIPDCTLTSGQPTVTNGVSVSSVGTTSGSATLTGDFSGCDIGDRVAGTGIPSDTYLATIVGDTGATMTKNATATGTITATVTHGFDQLLCEGMRVSLNPRGKYDITTVDGSPNIVITPSANNTFADINVGDLVQGRGSAASSIPDGTTVLAVSGNTVTLSNNVLFSRSGAQLAFYDPGIPIDTFVESIESDGSFTLTKNATVTGDRTISVGAVDNIVREVDIRGGVVRVDALGAPDLLPYPHIWLDVGNGSGRLEVHDGVYFGQLSSTSIRYRVANQFDPVTINENGITVIGQGRSPYTVARNSYGNQVIAPNLLTQLLFDDKLVDRASTFGNISVETYKPQIRVENLTITSASTAITAAAMPLKNFSGTSGSTTITVETFNIGSLTTNGTVTVTRGSGSFITDGVRIGMTVTGTDMPAGAQVATVSALSLTLTIAATGSTAGTATLTFAQFDLRRLIAVNAVIEHASIPAGAYAAEVNATTVILSTALTGNITSASVDVFNLAALRDGDPIYLNTAGAGTLYLSLDTPTLIYGTPTKTAAQIRPAAIDNGSGVSLMARGYKTASTRTYRISGNIDINRLTTGTKVEVHFWNAAMEKYSTFYSRGPGTADNPETFHFEFVQLIQKNSPISIMVLHRDSAARTITGLPSVSGLVIEPLG